MALKRPGLSTVEKLRNEARGNHARSDHPPDTQFALSAPGVPDAESRSENVTPAATDADRPDKGVQPKKATPPSPHPGRAATPGSTRKEKPSSSPKQTKLVPVAVNAPAKGVLKAFDDTARRFGEDKALFKILSRAIDEYIPLIEDRSFRKRNNSYPTSDKVVRTTRRIDASTLAEFQKFVDPHDVLRQIDIGRELGTAAIAVFIESRNANKG